MAATDAQRFGPYVILDRIGDGGMAEIFLAKMQGYSGFEKLIALKRILPRYSQNRTFAQMLIHEAKLAAALQHFNVVQVLDLGEIDRQVFIAMEYVRGRDLAAVLSNTYRRKEKLPLPLSLCIATEFMTGLDYAHRVRSSEGLPLGIIHRDISPQNILISYEGEVKVTDFGIARVAEKEGFQLPGNLHGKFGYMSPEQVLGQEIDQRSDIFSAGVVLYEMLTGQRLFRGKEHKETIKMIISHVIPPPSTINSEVPPSVDRICAKALARDRNMRYQTMGALLGELSRVADTLPRRAATRDLSVYMRRQFGNSAGGFTGARRTEASQISNVSGFHAKSGSISDIGALSPVSGGQRIPLGEILINQGAITAGDLEIVLAEQRARGGRIGELLVASGNISEEDLLRALSSQSGLPSISQEDLIGLPAPAKLLKRFPREAAEATMMLPISVNEQERSVRLAVSDPYDDRAILETKVVLGVNDVVVFLAKRSAIRSAISRWYGEESEGEAAAEPIFGEDEPTTALRPVVLIADADAATVEKLADRVKQEDCDVVTALDGKAARNLCRERKPTVAFLDAALPGIDGYNILLELRGQSSDAAIFITSSRGDEMRQAKALELGADDFIVKPFSLEVTTSKIRREIQKRSSGKRLIAPQVQFNGVSGSLKDMTALDIVQGLELGKKTAHVVLQYADGRSGEIAILRGDLRGCIAGHLLGEEAFYLLVRPADGLFRIEYRDSTTPQNITKPNTFLMIEAMRRLDEDDRGSGHTRARSHSGASVPATATLEEEQDLFDAPPADEPDRGPAIAPPSFPPPGVPLAPPSFAAQVFAAQASIPPVSVAPSAPPIFPPPTAFEVPAPPPANAFASPGFSAPGFSAPGFDAPSFDSSSFPGRAPPRREAKAPMPAFAETAGVHPSFIESSPVDGEVESILPPPPRTTLPPLPSEPSMPPVHSDLPPWSALSSVPIRPSAVTKPQNPTPTPSRARLGPWSSMAPPPLSAQPANAEDAGAEDPTLAVRRPGSTESAWSDGASAWEDGLANAEQRSVAPRGFSKLADDLTLGAEAEEDPGLEASEDATKAAFPSPVLARQALHSPAAQAPRRPPPPPVPSAVPKVRKAPPPPPPTSDDDD